MDDFYAVRRYGRFFALFEKWEPLLIEEMLDGPKPDKLIAVCVYKVGAQEVKRRLEGRVHVRRTVVLCKNCRATYPKDGLPADLAADAPIDEDDLEP